MKEELLSKFKDYNNELEKILEKKDFSRDSKNLLLSMFYKLETSYQDYEVVKRKVKSKKEYLENILENIKECNQIEIIKSNTEEFNKFQQSDQYYDVDLKLKKIRVINNELCLLSAILELNNFKIYLKEQYNLIRNSFPYLLNSANDMENIEVLRDFNAFSWNTVINKITDMNIKLIYENLKMAMSFDIIEKLKNSNENINLINVIREDLEKQYGNKETDKFLKLLFKISIILYIQKSDIERKRLLEEQEVIEADLKQIEDKNNYINDMIKNKRDLAKKVRKIDLILNDKNLLIKEYEKRNNELPEYNRIFNLTDLKERLQRERKKFLSKIEECNQKLEPKQYITDKQKLQEDKNLLKGIDFIEKDNNEKILYQCIDKLQLLFLEKILPKKIELLNDKENLMNLLYQVRYYYLIPYTIDQSVGDVEKYKEAMNNIQFLLLLKLYKLKMINTISTNEKMDIEIVKNIFNLRIISLEEIYIQLIKTNQNNYDVYIYDSKDTLEKKISLNLKFNQKDKIKLKRKVKLF